MSENDIIQSESDLESESNDFICDSDPEIEVISESYFDINAIDTLRKKNVKLKAKLLKGKNINETLKENLSISKKTIVSLDLMLNELTAKISLLEQTNTNLDEKLSQSKEKNKELVKKISELEENNKSLEQKNKELQEKIVKITCDKNKLETQVNNFTKLKNSWDSFTKKIVQDNFFLSRAVCFFFLASCSSFIYNYKQINNSN